MTADHPASPTNSLSRYSVCFTSRSPLKAECIQRVRVIRLFHSMILPQDLRSSMAESPAQPVASALASEQITIVRKFHQPFSEYDNGLLEFADLLCK
jgi:hypothetical protein